MKRLVCLAGLLLLGACATTGDETVSREDQLRPNCYSVDLFDPHPLVTPGAEVPVAAAAFIGEWGNGAWEGQWCHDVRVTQANADGTVELLEMHGPWAAIGADPTVFKRVGRVRNGVLTYRSFNRATVSYRIEGTYLIGRREMANGVFEAVLERTETLGRPLPSRRPANS